MSRKKWDKAERKKHERCTINEKKNILYTNKQTTHGKLTLFFPPSKKSFLSCASIRPLLRLLKSWVGNKTKSKSENAFSLETYVRQSRSHCYG